MDSSTRRRFMTEQKYKIVKEVLTTDTTVAEICRKHSISASQFYKWQESFFEGARVGLEAKKRGPASQADKRKIEQLEKDNSRMKDVIAEITAENITIKKRIGD